MKRLLIFIMSFALLIGNVYAADYDGDKKSDEIAAHGGSVAATSRLFIQDPADTDIVTYATFQELVTAVLGASYDTGTELGSLFTGKQDASAVLDTYASIDPSADVQSLLGAANEAAIREFLDLEAGTDFYSISAADLAFEAIDSNDFDPDRLAGDTDDDNLIDASLIDINGATSETSIAADDKVLIYDTSGTAVKAMTRGNFVTGIGAGQAVVLDIGDDGGNDSTDLGEIATTGDTNSIFTEDSADKLLINLGNNWPQADTALAAASQVITDNAIATVDDADATDNDFAKFTTDGLEGRSYAEVRQDLGIDSAANLESSLSLGAYASDILGAADSDALVTLLGLVAGDIPDLSATYEPQLVNSAGLYGALSDETGSGGGTPLAVFNYNPTLTGVTMAGNITLGSNEIQSTGDVTIQLGDTNGTYKLSVEDSNGTDVWWVDSDGITGTPAVNNPYYKWDENDGVDYFMGINDTTVDRIEIRRSATVNTNVDWYIDSDEMWVGGNSNLSTGHTYQINGSQINFANLAQAGNATPTGTWNFASATLQNIGAGTVTNGSNYTTISNDAADDTINELFDAINSWAAGVGAGTLVNLSDVGGSDVYTGGYILIGDNSDSYDPKAVSGVISLDASGSTAFADGDRGDITASGGSFTLDADVVAAAEMADADHGDVAWASGVATVQAVSGANAVDSDQYVDGSIDTAHLGNDQVTFAKLDDDGNFGPFTGAWDFTGGSLEIPNATDPDVDAAGEISFDTDDNVLRGYDGSNQVAMGRKIDTLPFTIVKPNDFADATRDKLFLWENASGMSFIVTRIKVWSDTDDTALNIEEYDADGASNNATVDAINATDGTGPYTATETTITGATIEAGHTIYVDFDDTDDPGQVSISISGYYNANVD